MLTHLRFLWPAGPDPTAAVKWLVGHAVDYLFARIPNQNSGAVITEIMSARFAKCYANAQRAFFHELDMTGPISNILPLVLNSIRESVRQSNRFR